jgi:hypothetical protein
MTRTSRSIALLMVSTLPAAAQVPDHLKCYKVKDPIPRVAYTADLNGFVPEAGCLVKMPAKLFCVDTTKTNVNPTPPGAPAGNPAGRFACYKLKCPRVTPPSLEWTDQFGARTLQPVAAKMLCAPEGASTTTSSTTTSSTTTTTNPPCNDMGGGCSGCGTCGDGRCHFTGGGNGCGTIDNNPQCVSASSCVPSTCTAHGQCGPGRVCVVNGGQNLCCNECH